jgi:hypothetical protein
MLTDEQRSRSRAAYEADGVRDRVGQAAELLGETMKMLLNAHVERHAMEWTAFESPIEIIFFSWWVAFDVAHSAWHMGNIRGPMLHLSTQREITIGASKYRLDFVVVPTSRTDDEHRLRDELFPKVAIELDGHDFHEKTKEQVTYRNRRDRDLQAAGWRVFHISGSELARRPRDATQEVYEHCLQEYESFQYNVYKTTLKPGE